MRIRSFNSISNDIWFKVSSQTNFDFNCSNYMLFVGGGYFVLSLSKGINVVDTETLQKSDVRYNIIGDVFNHLHPYFQQRFL